MVKAAVRVRLRRLDFEPLARLPQAMANQFEGAPEQHTASSILRLENVSSTTSTRGVRPGMIAELSLRRLGRRLVSHGPVPKQATHLGKQRLEFHWLGQ